MTYPAKLREARIEFGEAAASRLKLSADGTKVLWPQPTDSPYDPQNWSDRRKNMHLFIITLAAIVPDFSSGIGWFLLLSICFPFIRFCQLIVPVRYCWDLSTRGPIQYHNNGYQRLDIQVSSDSPLYSEERPLTPP